MSMKNYYDTIFIDIGVSKFRFSDFWLSILRFLKPVDL
jgi:hypothetical protein